VGLVSDLLFVGSVVFVLVLVVRIAVHAVRGRRDRMIRGVRTLVCYGAGYVAVLLAVALSMPRRAYSQGERECFDDWCAAGIGIAPGAAIDGCDGANVWIGTLEVSSDAKRIRQRAADAVALLEDGSGRRYESCGEPAPGGGRGLRDELGPGESFRVLLAFSLPAGARPAGFVIRHGAFPGLLIIGDDQSLAHRPTLLAVARAGGG
jgi:hypothetical protein